MRYKLVIVYDGSEYCGWQVQPNGISVQEKITKTLEKILQQKISLVGSGRTDAGVHAIGQVAHFSANSSISKEQLHYSLNVVLPKDISVISTSEVSDDFHAQKSASKKTYWYLFHLSPINNPFIRDFTWQLSYHLDFNAMQKASKLILGKHDFRAFANQANQGSCSKNPIRTINDTDWSYDEPFLRFSISANGFFYKMVRNIVGTLIDIGRGKLQVEDMTKILLSHDRKNASPAAPPQGLYLHSVEYQRYPTIFLKELFPHLRSFYKNKNPGP